MAEPATPGRPEGVAAPSPVRSAAAGPSATARAPQRRREPPGASRFSRSEKAPAGVGQQRVEANRRQQEPAQRLHRLAIDQSIDQRNPLGVDHADLLHHVHLNLSPTEHHVTANGARRRPTRSCRPSPRQRCTSNERRCNRTPSRPPMINPRLVRGRLPHRRSLAPRRSRTRPAAIEKRRRDPEGSHLTDVATATAGCILLVQESLCAAVTACRRCRPRDLHAKRCAQRPVRSDKSPPAGHDRSKGHAPAKELAPPGATRRQAARSSGSPAPSADSPPTRNRNAAFACRLAANTAVGSERRTRSHDSM